MAYDKIVDSAALDAALTATADAIRAKTGSSDKIEWTEQGFAAAVEGISGGGGSGGGGAVPWNDVTFVDYDGTVLYSYTTAEAKALSELPPLPSQPGLICQGWNYDLETIKSYDRPVTVGATYITDDSTTRIYITLHDGRTSPMLGCCPKGTVTVDWGDGTEPDVLTGTSVTSVKWTPTHNYAAVGDYVIRLTVDGEMGLAGSSSSNQYAYILRHKSSSSTTNTVYQNSIQKIELGANVTSIGNYAFNRCYSLSNVVIPNSVTSIGESTFNYCNSLSNVVIPNSVTSIGNNAFYSCLSLSNVVIPENVTSIGNNTFYGCLSLSNIVFPENATSIGGNAFNSCNSLSNIVIPENVTSIGSTTFYGCAGIKYYDFSQHTSVPTLANTNAFSGISADCEIRVPAALYDEWIAATNWSSLASYIVAV